MCIVYNNIGSYEVVKSELKKNGINDFNSIKETLDFKKKYNFFKEQVYSENKLRLENEIRTLNLELEKLNLNLDSFKNEQEFDFKIKSINLLLIYLIRNKFFRYFLLIFKLIKKEKLQQLELSNKYFETKTSINKTKKKLYLLTCNFDKQLEIISKQKIDSIEYKKNILQNLYPVIQGAIGEKKVENELKKLSDDNYLINDFKLYFKNPIYIPSENRYIKSIQIDHLLINQAGIFSIETKNWSIHSINNDNLYSPVKQTRRSGYALFKVLSEIDTNKILSVDYWGSKKIPLKNIIVLINHKKDVEFQYVKVLKLEELNKYITYFKNIFSKKETEKIVSYLLSINNKIY